MDLYLKTSLRKWSSTLQPLFQINAQKKHLYYFFYCLNAAVILMAMYMSHHIICSSLDTEILAHEKFHTFWISR